MKVLQINAVCGNGSTGRICTDIADQLKEYGHEVRIIYGNGNSSYEDAVRVGSDLTVKLNALWARVSGWNAHGAIIETRQIICEIESFAPDIVHLHNLHANFVNLPMLLDYLASHRICTVVTLHDCWLFTGKCTHYTLSNCRKWEAGCHDCPKLKDDIPSILLDKTKQMWQEKKAAFESISDLAVIGVSDWITNEAKKSFLAKARIVRRIYNWIDLDIFNPNGRAAPVVPNRSDKFTVFCASAGWEKGSERFKMLIALSDILDRDMQIVVAGNMDSSVLLPGNVIQVGYIQDQKEMASFYRKADVYVHLSKEDTFGKVIAEALACGTPTIVFRSTACPECVGTGRGYAAESGNVEEIAEYCREIMKKGKAYYSESCVAFAKKNFEKHALIDNTIQLYSDLLCRKSH